ncbi:MAG TPA: TetR/AcrR family transcriptional regulator [Sporichthyaceae bacterium]|jgi:AcrR family transcriptional regulator|nr:TetR/AcrR family transcriptional regulator [Sporichthyaceae bacterium]
MPSITRKAAGSRAQRRDEIRRKMLTAVEEMLTEGETFTELSVERLVARAGVARSTFYVYFADKGELLRAWLDEITGDLDSVAKRWWNLSGDAQREDLHEALGAVFDVYRPHTSLMAAAFDAAAYDPGVRESVMSLIGHNSAGLRKHIRAGQRDGFVDETLAAGEVAEWLTWMAERGLHQLVRGADDAAYGKLLDGYTAIIWNTLYAGAACRSA